MNILSRFPMRRPLWRGYRFEGNFWYNGVTFLKVKIFYRAYDRFIWVPLWLTLCGNGYWMRKMNKHLLFSSFHWAQCPFNAADFQISDSPLISSIYLDNTHQWVGLCSSVFLNPESLGHLRFRHFNFLFSYRSYFGSDWSFQNNSKNP